MAWGRITAKPGRLYLHVFDWPADGKLVVPAAATTGRCKARFLGENKRAILKAAVDGTGVELTLPPRAPDPVATVIELNGTFAVKQ